MAYMDEEEMENTQKKRTKKIKILIIVLIVILLISSMGMIGLIMYRTYNPTQITSYIDGVLVQGLDTILDFQTDENGNTEIYVPIREFANYLSNSSAEIKYETYKGDYNPKTEEDSKCHVIRDGYEVAIFTEKSKTIYKLDLQSRSENYEECYIDKDVFKSNDQLYTSVDGIEKGFNLYFQYDDAKKTIKIYTLDYLIQTHSTKLQNNPTSNYGLLTLSSENYSDAKSIFDNLLIIQSESGKYGIISAEDYSKYILEPQYDNIQFINTSSTFLVESNGKVGIFSEDGKRIIDLIYDEISSMGKDSNLYKVTTNDMCGILDGKGNMILYPEYEEIGIDVSPYSYNGVKNGYILLNKIIPIKQNELWGFCDTKGKMISDGFKYTTIGCSNISKANNKYELLAIPDCDVVVIGDEYDKYSFMDSSGKDTMLPFVFDEMYMKNTTGQISYCMKYNDKEYDAVKNLINVKEK